MKTQYSAKQTKSHTVHMKHRRMAHVCKTMTDKLEAWVAWDIVIYDVDIRCKSNRGYM